MSAWLMVRAEVGEADREAFDRWYENEHLPDAMKAFAIDHAWRGWSDVEAGIHDAFYEFPSIERAREVVNGSEAIKGMISEFDRCWEDRVVRSREIIDRTQLLGA